MEEDFNIRPELENQIEEKLEKSLRPQQMRVSAESKNNILWERREKYVDKTVREMTNLPQ